MEAELFKLDVTAQMPEVDANIDMVGLEEIYAEHGSPKDREGRIKVIDETIKRINEDSPPERTPEMTEQYENEYEEKIRESGGRNKRMKDGSD